MATLALGIAGAALGSALLPGGIGLLGTTISGAVIGRAAGALAGSLIDQALLGGSGQTSTREGPRLSDLHVMASTEGAPIPRLYGRARLGGQCPLAHVRSCGIWRAGLLRRASPLPPPAASAASTN